MNQQNNYPQIYTLADCPVMGTFGETIQIFYGEKKCEICGKVEQDRLEYLDYCLDSWDGEDLMKVAQSYAVSIGLCKAIEEAGINGCSFKEMTISRADTFEETSPGMNVPIFYHLMIHGRVEGPLVWFEFISECPACGRYKLKMTDAYFDGQISDGSSPPGPPRKIFKNSWQGDDFFLHTKDPGPPIVTQRVVELIKEFNVKGVYLTPAVWVD